MTEVLACPRCGTPIAEDVARCPMCGMARGIGAPSPFTARWMAFYGALVVVTFVAVLVGVLVTR